MSFELAALAAVAPVAQGAAQPPLWQPAGYGASLTDVTAFSQSLERAQQRAQAVPSEAVRSVVRPLEHINVEASQLAAHAKAAMASGNELTPGEMIMLTVRCHEFMFHCQLTSNIANRTSDGLQQLFRQQA
ncbi:hypothetical protein M8A51_01805 [Schlegelella sp. S2-27]|uniref:Uncharacterized protein n=1 Tax=Caldimonas mangrovi TaxID=2944811 RepID=A0ABT0YK17_9BURK|nr:hypothetical protein [Caldimonas mangrovi]MCM5678258.1 hypothetical protein [Caldimonas mangrovi]